MRFDPGESYAKSTDYRESRPISPYSTAAEGNWAAWGEAFKAAGDVYKSAIVGYDAYQEELVKQGVRQIADKNRDSYTDRLEESYDTVAGKNRGMYTEATPTPTLSGDGVEVSGQSRLPPVPPGQRNLFEEKPETPAAVENRLNRLKTLEGARARGSISNTDYWGRVDSELKELRDRFPNYADVIDRQASAILGVNPANAYVSGLVSDINSFIKQGASERDKIRREIWKANDKGYVGMDKLLQDFDAGKKNQYEIMYEINKQAAIDRKYQLLDIRRKTIQANEEIVDADARKQAEFLVTNTANTYVDTISWGPGFAGRKGFGEWLEAQRTRQIQAPNQTESLMIVQKINEAEANFITHANKEFDRGDPTLGGRSLTGDLKGKNADKNAYIDQGRKMFAFFRDYISKDNITIASAGEMYRKAAISDEVNVLVARKGFQPILVYGELAKQFPGMAKDIGEAYIRDSAKFKKTIGDLAPLVFSQKIDVLNPYDPTTPLDVVNTIQRQVRPPAVVPGVTPPPNTGTNPEHSGDVFDSVINQIESIGNSKIDVKEKGVIFDKTFSEKGAELIGKFSREGYITRYGVFQRLSTPEFIKGVQELDKEPGRAGTFNKYSEWMKNQFANVLLKRDIADLSAATADNKVSIAWDDTKFQFKDVEFNYPKPGDKDYVRPPGANERIAERKVKEQVARINQYMSHLVNIAKASGENVNEFLIKTLADAGYSPMRSDLRTGQTEVNVTKGLPQQWFNAILASQMKLLKKEETPEEKERLLREYNR